jgi:hypothetical protein
MTDTLSLGPVLDLIEQLRQADYGSAYTDNQVIELRRLNIPALRALAEQHAAQLRRDAEGLDDAGIADVPSDLNDAADFLCAPRREPEAE